MQHCERYSVAEKHSFGLAPLLGFQHELDMDGNALCMLVKQIYPFLAIPVHQMSGLNNGNCVYAGVTGSPLNEVKLGLQGLEMKSLGVQVRFSWLADTILAFDGTLDFSHGNQAFARLFVSR